MKKIIFVDKIPEHENVYSNGFVCLGWLYTGWTPVYTVKTCILEIFCMLTSATKKARPFNDAEFCKKSEGRSPSNFIWNYDDEKCWLK
jgi:ubiquitin-conjugating enzyme E2 W